MHSLFSFLHKTPIEQGCNVYYINNGAVTQYLHNYSPIVHVTISINLAFKYNTSCNVDSISVSVRTALTSEQNLDAH